MPSMIHDSRGSLAPIKNENFRASLKVALADGKISTEEKEHLDKIKDQGKSHLSSTKFTTKNNVLRLRVTIYNAGFFRDKADECLEEISYLFHIGFLSNRREEHLKAMMFAYLSGNLAEAKILESGYELKYGGFFTRATQISNISQTAKDPLISAYETATADGEVSSSEIKALKELVEA